MVEREARGSRYGGVDAVAVADGFDRVDAAVPFQEVGGYGDENDGCERTRHLARHLRSEQDDEDAHQADAQCPEVGGVEVLEVDGPFAEEVFGKGAVDAQAEEVFDLGGEDREGDTRREAHDDGVGDELDDHAELEESEQDEDDPSHDGGDGESLDTG